MQIYVDEPGEETWYIYKCAVYRGLSAPFGSGPVVESGAPGGSGWAPNRVGWRLDEPHVQLDLAPAILLDTTVCGQYTP